ncbi:Uncharacterized protein FWK35_00034709, partial [Aphis craccivora]
WGLKLNQTKSLHSTFTLRLRECPQLFLNNQPLPYSQNVKYLGLSLDRRVTWVPHIRSKRLTLNDRSRQLRQLLTSIHIHLNKMLLIPTWVYNKSLKHHTTFPITHSITTCPVSIPFVADKPTHARHLFLDYPWKSSQTAKAQVYLHWEAPTLCYIYLTE